MASRSSSGSRPIVALAAALALSAFACGDDVDRDRDLGARDVEDPTMERERTGGEPESRYGRAPTGEEPDVAAAPTTPGGRPDTGTTPEAGSPAPEADRWSGFEDHRTGAQAVAMDLAQHTILMPSTLVVTQGGELRIRNDAGQEQRIRIRGLEVDQTLPVGQEASIRVPRSSTGGGALYSIHLASADGERTASAGGSAGIPDAEPGADADPPAAAGRPGTGQALQDGDAVAATLIVLPARSGGADTPAAGPARNPGMEGPARTPEMDPGMQEPAGNPGTE